MTKRFLFLVVTTFLAEQTMAQFISGSPYSVYGIGDLRQRTSGLNRSLGGTGIAIRDSLSTNHINPASYASIASPVSMIYESGIYLESAHYTTAAMSEQKSFGGLTNLNMWVKLKPFWGSTVGLAPYSNVSYRIKALKDFGYGKTTINYTGSGGFIQLYWGNGFAVTKNLSIGVNASLVFGSITKTESIALNNADMVLEKRIYANRLSLDAGIQYRFRVSKKYAIVLGATVDQEKKLEGSRELSLYESTPVTTDTLSLDRDTSPVHYIFPGKVGLGISAETTRSLLAADFQFQNWSDADFGEQNVTYEDVKRISVGYMYKGNSKSDNYLSRISLRSGFHYQNHYFKLKNTLLDNWGGSFGMGLPIQGNRATLQLTYAYDCLGTVSNGLVKENSSKVMVDIIVRDIWGIRRRFD